jgi:hypothetical protein
MSGPGEAFTKGLQLALAAMSHTGWWLQWQAGRQPCREVAKLGPLTARGAEAERRAA